jgi:NADH-quinone oxidoreductase subunit H
MTLGRDLVALLFFPGGLFVLVMALAFEWANRKLLARLQNRVGPRWYQTVADLVKLLSKDEIVPDRADPRLFHGLPVVALAGALTAALYVPVGRAPAYGFEGDLIVAVTLMGLLSLSVALAGMNTISRFTMVGTARTLTQLFSYEAPFLLALLGPAVLTGTWQIGTIVDRSAGDWLVLTQPIGFLLALIALVGKLELPPFDAPEAKTEIVAGPLTEYSARGLGLFRLARHVEFVVGLALIASIYLGGTGTPLAFAAKTAGLLLMLALAQSVFVRLRIDQTVGLWWRYGAITALGHWLALIVWRLAVS